MPKRPPYAYIDMVVLDDADPHGTHRLLKDFEAFLARNVMAGDIKGTRRDIDIAAGRFAAHGGTMLKLGSDDSDLEDFFDRFMGVDMVLAGAPAAVLALAYVSKQEARAPTLERLQAWFIDPQGSPSVCTVPVAPKSVQWRADGSPDRPCLIRAALQSSHSPFMQALACRAGLEDGTGASLPAAAMRPRI